ncbi:unnamed protein product [Gadus morhua 'NCC']
MAFQKRKGRATGLNPNPEPGVLRLLCAAESLSLCSPGSQTEPGSERKREWGRWPGGGGVLALRPCVEREAMDSQQPCWKMWIAAEVFGIFIPGDEVCSRGPRAGDHPGQHGPSEHQLLPLWRHRLVPPPRCISGTAQTPGTERWGLKQWTTVQISGPEPRNPGQEPSRVSGCFPPLPSCTRLHNLRPIA